MTKKQINMIAFFLYIFWFVFTMWIFISLKWESPIANLIEFVIQFIVQFSGFIAIMYWKGWYD